jgi:hypothetical protein
LKTYSNRTHQTLHQGSCTQRRAINELADSLAAEATQSDPARSIARPLSFVSCIPATPANQGPSILGSVLGEMKISTAKKQVLQLLLLQSRFPAISAPQVERALCGHPAETQSHIQCLCLVLKTARIRAHHNLAQLLLKGIEDPTQRMDHRFIVTEQTLSGLHGLSQPENQIHAWQRAWNEVIDLHLEGKEV